MWYCNCFYRAWNWKIKMDILHLMYSTCILICRNASCNSNRKNGELCKCFPNDWDLQAPTCPSTSVGGSTTKRRIYVKMWKIRTRQLYFRHTKHMRSDIKCPIYEYMYVWIGHLLFLAHSFHSSPIAKLPPITGYGYSPILLRTRHRIHIHTHRKLSWAHPRWPGISIMFTYPWENLLVQLRTCCFSDACSAGCSCQPVGWLLLLLQTLYSAKMIIHRGKGREKHYPAVRPPARLNETVCVGECLLMLHV